MSNKENHHGYLTALEAITKNMGRFLSMIETVPVKPKKDKINPISEHMIGVKSKRKTATQVQGCVRKSYQAKAQEKGW